MDSTRFDALAKTLGQARSRRTVLTTLGAAALGAIGLKTGGVTATQGIPAATPTAVVAAAGLAANNATLFVQTATSGTLTPNPAASATPAAGTPTATQPGAYRLTLYGHTGETVGFSDRPRRDFGEVPTPQFFQGMGFTRVNPPNAALVTASASGAEAVTLLELTTPHYDAATETLTYAADLLHAYPNTRGSALAPLAGEASPGAPPPATFGAAALFIDDCPDIDNCYGDYGFGAVVGPVPGGPVGTCWSWQVGGCNPCSGQGLDYYAGLCNNAYPACDNQCRVWIV